MRRTVSGYVRPGADGIPPAWAQGVAYLGYGLPPTLDPLRGHGTLRAAPSSHTWTQTRRWEGCGVCPMVHPSRRSAQ